MRVKEQLNLIFANEFFSLITSETCQSRKENNKNFAPFDVSKVERFCNLYCCEITTYACECVSQIDEMDLIMADVDYVIQTKVTDKVFKKFPLEDIQKYIEKNSF